MGRGCRGGSNEGRSRPRCCARRTDRTKIDWLPGDGWIKLAPGETYSWDKDNPLEPSLEQLRHWMRQLRGSVLSESFVIENELVMLALADEFGSNDHGTASPTYFEREQDWREDHSLERKIERAKPIIRARRSKEFSDGLIQKLAEYRALRHLLAHYPCWFEPVNDGHLTVKLKPFISDRAHIWEIDEAQARTWAKLLMSVRTSVENIRREIVGAPPIPEPSSS